MMKKNNSTSKSYRMSLQFTLTLLIGGVFFAVNGISLAIGYFILVSSKGYTVTVHQEVGMFPKLLTMLSVIIAGAVVAAIINRKPIEMIGEMMAAINEVAKGDYTVRLNWKKYAAIGEITDVATSFNTMTEELGKVELLKREFINDFSHEFKTPIASISGFAKVLKYGNSTEEERAEYLDIIIEESNRLTELATNVLNLSRVENQSILSNQSLFNVTEEVRQTVALLGEKMENKELELEFYGAEIDLEGNRELLKQVWINLLDNAIKFSPQGGSLYCTLREEEGKVVVAIANEGTPIGQEDLPRIFDQFYQGESSHATKGNGLGLAIAKKIIALHHGTITIGKNQEDCIEFIIMLPKNRGIIL